MLKLTKAKPESQVEQQQIEREDALQDFVDDSSDTEHSGD
jgi:hypothetical protein